MSELIKYGNRYFCVKTNLSADGEMFVMADSVEVSAVGALVLWREFSTGQRVVNLAIAPGSWQSVYAASLVDGSPVAIDHWRQVDEVKEKIIKLLTRNGSATVREMAQYIRGLDAKRAQVAIDAMSEASEVTSARVGRTVRYYLA